MTFLGIVLILLAIGGLIIVGAVQGRYQRLQSVMRGLLVSYITIMLILTAGELYFRYFYAESGWLWTLAGQNWHTWYVKRNSLGFRDREWTSEDYADKSTVLVFGDSFTEGFGIKNVEDRYSNVLGELLGDEYAVLNIGVANTSTRAQLDILKSYPLQNPDVIIWQYFINDINDAALSIGEQWWPTLPPRPPKWIDEGSYLANYLYWQIAPAFVAIDVTHDNSYWDWAYNTYDNYGIWQIHEQEMRDILDFIENTEARLIVIIFPNPLEPVESIPYVDRVAQYLETQGVTEIMPLYDDISYFAEQREEGVVVSARDFHPNTAFNRYLGQKLYETYFATQ